MYDIISPCKRAKLNIHVISHNVRSVQALDSDAPHMYQPQKVSVKTGFTYYS